VVESEQAGDDICGDVIDRTVSGPREGPQADERGRHLDVKLRRDHPRRLVDRRAMVDDLGQPIWEHSRCEIGLEVE
jgi:hypothetical protein